MIFNMLGLLYYAIIDKKAYQGAQMYQPHMHLVDCYALEVFYCAKVSNKTKFLCKIRLDKFVIYYIKSS